MMRQIWLAIGIVALALGIVGIFLPLMPTVPFLLLAAFAFSRSSQRLHNWLITHKIYGPPIRDWQERGSISKRAKLLATASILTGIAISVLIGLPPVLLLLQAAIFAATLLFIWSRPSE